MYIVYIYIANISYKRPRHHPHTQTQTERGKYPFDLERTISTRKIYWPDCLTWLRPIRKLLKTKTSSERKKGWGSRLLAGLCLGFVFFFPLFFLFLSVFLFLPRKGSRCPQKRAEAPQGLWVVLCLCVAFRRFPEPGAPSAFRVNRRLFVCLLENPKPRNPYPPWKIPTSQRAVYIYIFFRQYDDDETTTRASTFIFQSETLSGWVAGWLGR